MSAAYSVVDTDDVAGKTRFMGMLFVRETRRDVDGTRHSAHAMPTTRRALPTRSADRRDRGRHAREPHRVGRNRIGAPDWHAALRRRRSAGVHVTATQAKRISRTLRIAVCWTTLATCIASAGSACLVLYFGVPQISLTQGSAVNAPRHPQPVVHSPLPVHTQAGPLGIPAPPDADLAHDAPRAESSPAPRHDPSEMQANEALPPAPDDPELDRALADLDMKADRDRAAEAQPSAPGPGPIPPPSAVGPVGAGQLPGSN